MDDELRTQTLDPQQAIADPQQLSEQATRLFSEAIDKVPTTYQGELGKAFGLMQQAFEAWATASGITYHNLSPGVTTPGTIGKGNWP